jgi:predicted  nucleic acid-binding Zn-ribbon protein
MQLGPEGEFERKRLSRLVKLQGSDAGFFLLATHSYIESWLRQKYHQWESDQSFNDLIFKFKIDLIENSKSFPKELSVLQVLRTREKTSTAVLHHFIDIDSEEAAAASYRLIQFCSLAGIEFEEQLEKLRDHLSIWSSQKQPIEGTEELTVLRKKLSDSLRHNKKILEEIDQLKTLQLEAEHYSSRIKFLESEIELLKNKKDNISFDELNIEKQNTEQKKKKAEKNILNLDSASEYLGSLSRISSYTRTRFDFERDITKLTPEQQKVLDSINLTDDFLVKGGAGTGKTLVLIKALEKALSLDEAELSFVDDKTSVRLLTFNRTLAKYDKYLAEVLEQEKDAEVISTVDKFLYDKLRLIDESYRIIYKDGYAVELAGQFNTTDFHDDVQLAHEIEDIIFAGDLSEKEYIGVKTASCGEREEIWKIRGSVIQKMKDYSSFTKNYSRKLILEYIENNPDNSSLKDIDFIFIDEVQDLAAVDLKTVKACANRAVIMAGDADQSIYQSGFTFARGGIDIRGTTKILRTNFRNTVEIHKLAESYRLKSGRADTDSMPEAFRTGPPPEMYQGVDKNELTAMMMQRVRIFIEDLSYDPENICILVPSGKDIEPLKTQLKEQGFDSHDLRNEDFSFKTRNIVRISTMHSSKGLDFPIVLMFLHKLPRTSSSQDWAAREKMTRNLIYVSMTRAMDHLNVFTIEGETEKEIKDLLLTFG